MKRLNIAIKIAKKAGDFLIKNFTFQKFVKSHLHEKDLKTEWDKLSDKIIIKELKKYFKNDSILTEESGYIKGKNKNSLWIIDPLDGTGNYTRGNPFFAVSIAYKKNNDLLLGVILAPFLKELYICKKGKGSYLNDKKIKVSGESHLDYSYILFCEGKEKSRKRTALIYKTLREKILDIRKLGAASLESAYVARGSADAYLTTKIEPWDISAGILLVEEAGGKVSNFKGKKYSLKTEDLILSNKKIHKNILDLVK